MKYATDGKVAVTYRKLGQMFNRSDKTIKRDLFDAKIKKKRISALKIDEKTIKRQKQRIAKAKKGILKPSNGLIIIMDDESYFNFQENKSAYYFTSDKKPVKNEVKFKSRGKFPKKLMV